MRKINAPCDVERNMESLVVHLVRVYRHIQNMVRRKGLIDCKKKFEVLKATIPSLEMREDLDFLWEKVSEKHPQGKKYNHALDKFAKYQRVDKARKLCGTTMTAELRCKLRDSLLVHSKWL